MADPVSVRRSGLPTLARVGGANQMATTLSTRIRTDVIGSLLRPPAVLEAHTAFREGRLPEAELRKIEDAAILEAVRCHEEVDLNEDTNGEMRRVAWMTVFCDAVDGFAEL